MAQSRESLEARRKRLAYRSHHRGSKEMDLMMGSFADKFLPAFGPRELAEYERIMTCDDPELYDWLLGHTPVPHELQNGTMECLCRHVREQFVR
ncbi:MAG: succinate dehydrogenase assembly factor 2 [Alphaproteobacteria bacterium]